MAVAIIALGGLAVWTAVVTRDRARSLAEAGLQTSGHLRATQALGQIDVVADEMEDEPTSPEREATARTARRVLADALDRMEDGVYTETRALARASTSDVRQLDAALQALIAAAPVGEDSEEDLRIDELLERLQARFHAFNADPSRHLHAEVAAARAAERSTHRMTLLLVPFGLVGVALCFGLLRSYRRRSETAARKALELHRHDARTDELTGLANRRGLQERLGEIVASRGSAGAAVALLDLDEFKSVNDICGHGVGDLLLVEVARRLRSAVRPADTIARLGGDEFVVLLESVESCDHALLAADRIATQLAAPVRIGTEQFVVTASMGLTLMHGSDSRGTDELLRDADTAMYAAKAAGKGRCELFENGMHSDLVAHTELVRDLRNAVSNGQLRVLYQPQIELSSGRMTGVEALVRWQRPDGGLVTPDRFIPVAESTGTIVAIDDWVMREACRQLRAWDDAGLPPLHMAVNVSARRLVTGDLAGTIAAVAQETAVDARRLEIEITETVAVEHEPEAMNAIVGLRALGVRLAIDDFGTGHSALSRLQTFPVDRLKIDRSFVAALADGNERGSLVDAMIAMGESLGLDVVAEGVETQEHLRALRRLGCGSAQGYLFSKPVAAAEIERLTRAGIVLAPPEEQRDWLATLGSESNTVVGEREIRNLLGEVGRLTGLESTYLTRIDWSEALQRITHARNTGAIDIAEGLAVDWSDTVCRRALEQGIAYTDDVPAAFPDSQAAAALGLQTYISVPVVDADGHIGGTLCGASTTRVALTPEAVKVMERFAAIIARQAGARPAAV